MDSGSFWQEAGALIAGCVLLAGCPDDVAEAETDTDDGTTSSTAATATTPTTTLPVTTTTTSSSTTVDPSTSTSPPDTSSTGDPPDSTSSGEAMTSTGQTTGMTTGATTGMTTGTTAGDDVTTGPAPDLCDEDNSTHCIEFGLNGSALFDEYPIDSGVFDDLVDEDIIVGISLNVASLTSDTAECNGVGGTDAHVWMAGVVDVVMSSGDAAADTYLNDEVITEFLAEGVGATIRMVATGAATPAQFQVTLSPTPPGHQFNFFDNNSYTPACDMVDIDSTIGGDNASYRLDFFDAVVTDRVQGNGAEYTFYPVP